MENRTPTQKRTVAITEKKTGLSSVSNLILIGVLLAAGAVLKLFLSSYFTVMKPNFVIAMYCLAILLIKPKVYEGAIIGILAGAICQFFPGTPYINLISEPLGAVAMVLLMKLPMKIGKFDLHPLSTWAPPSCPPPWPRLWASSSAPPPSMPLSCRFWCCP